MDSINCFSDFMKHPGNFIPRPIRDIVLAPSTLKRTVHSLEQMCTPGSARAAIIGIFGGGWATLPIAKRMIQAAIRIGIAVLGVFFVIGCNRSMIMTTALVGLISLPAAITMNGGLLLIGGISVIAQAIVTNSLTSLGLGSFLMLGGFLTLEFHDIFPIGLGEGVIQSVAEEYQGAITQAIK